MDFEPDPLVLLPANASISVGGLGQRQPELTGAPRRLGNKPATCVQFAHAADTVQVQLIGKDVQVAPAILKPLGVL